VLVALLAFLAFGAGTASAKAAKASKAPCWKLLLNDWYPDGRIDGTYPKHCYTEAINHLPEDVRDYGAARSDITRALLNAIATNNRNGGPPFGPDSLIPGEGKRSLQGHKKDGGFLHWLAAKLGPGSATGIPLPLLILAGLGLLLVAAAGASFAARWIQARRAQPRPATVPPAPPNRRK